MLADLEVHPTIPAADMDRAKKFYEEKLGLSPKSEETGGLFYECAGGTSFVIFPSPNAGKNTMTYAGWETPNIEATMKELKEKGVVFEEYDSPMTKTIDGVASFGKDKASWFKDSEGNTLGLFQMG